MMGASHVANADALDDIKKSGKIRIAIDLGVPPYGMTDAQMQPTGLDVEAAKMLAKDWGLQFEHVPTTGASRIPALQTGKADLVISSLSYTAERAKVIDFSQGYAVLRTVIAAPKSVNVKKPRRSRRQDRRHGARHHARHPAHQGRPQGHEAGALRGRRHRGPGLPERPGRHLLDRRDDRAAARQEEPGPPGRGQVRARQLQALRRHQEGRDAAASRRSTSGCWPTSRTAS